MGNIEQLQNHVIEDFGLYGDSVAAAALRQNYPRHWARQNAAHTRPGHAAGTGCENCGRKHATGKINYPPRGFPVITVEKQGIFEAVC